eukprot:GEMP01024768.1.p1 GENE.GEMP01024768.1~~GEMP01024768.1.p1  ORF type:complete len:611 (+),score=120.83 GEMP01024768.1:83-1915(+)
MTAAVVGRIPNYVPNYDIYGHQHHRCPFKDKAIYGTQKPIWTHGAKFKTRAELRQHRQAERVPHISYDIDGDGVVGSNDYFIARHFDKTCKGGLTKEERAECDKALGNDFRNGFLMGLEKHGTLIPFAIQQKRGKIITPDTAFELGETYPPHYNAHVKPKHRTRTEMKIDSILERREGAKVLKEKWDAQHPERLDESVVTMTGYVEEPRISHIAQRAQADHEKQRVKCGLYPVNTSLNPEREHMEPGLTYVEEPEFRTRCQMSEHRKAVLQEELEATRLVGEETKVPLSVRLNEREAAAFEFRKCPDDAMTKSLLDKQRKCERIEYDRTHFGVESKQFPRYSDQPHPFWIMARCASAPAASSHARCPLLMSKKVPQSAPMERPHVPPDLGATMLERPRTVNPLSSQSKTAKRWSSNQIDKGNLRDAPRLFDSLNPAKTLSADHIPTETFSSFDCVRKPYIRNVAKSQRHAEVEPPKSQLAPPNGGNHNVLARSHSGTGFNAKNGLGSTAVGKSDSLASCVGREYHKPASQLRHAQGNAGAHGRQNTSYGKIEFVEQKHPVRITDTLNRQSSVPHLRTTDRTGGIRTAFESMTVLAPRKSAKNLRRPHTAG